jgi:hypothetical protein
MLGRVCAACFYILSNHRFGKNSTKLFYLFEFNRNIIDISKLKQLPQEH